jgi:hypothetical protein
MADVAKMEKPTTPKAKYDDDGSDRASTIPQLLDGNTPIIHATIIWSLTAN